MHAPAALHLEDTHPVDGTLAVGTLALAVAGLLLFLLDAPRAAMACGAVGVVTGLWGQMVSRTRPERFVDVVGLVAAAVAFALGASNAGVIFTLM